MIIERILSYFADEIKALNFVEVYGGVARLHREKVVIDPKLNLEQFKFMPISCAIDGDVAPGKRVQRFRELSPNDKYKSILYWEVSQPFTDQGGFRSDRRSAANEKQRVMKGRARLIGWLNLQKLGVTACNSAADAIFALLPVLHRRLQYPTIPIENAEVEIKVISEVAREFSIFSKYSYSPMQYTFFYPFDYFAIDVEVSAILPLGCIPDFPIANPIDCVDFTVVS